MTKKELEAWKNYAAKTSMDVDGQLIMSEFIDKFRTDKDFAEEWSVEVRKYVTHRNRYGDYYTFTKLEDGNVLWEGDFKYCRYGWPNVYKEAYEQYRKDGGDLHIEDFKKEVHNYIHDENGKYVGPSEIANKYATMVYSDRNTINMVDPSGGPYLTTGNDLGAWLGEEFENRIIHSFESLEAGYLIKTYGKFDHLQDRDIIGGII